MKKVFNIILTILAVFLPIFALVDKSLFELSLIFWPFVIIALLILKIKNRDNLKIGESYIYKINEKENKEKNNENTEIKD